jgi:hypothetical protein
MANKTTAAAGNTFGAIPKGMGANNRKTLNAKAIKKVMLEKCFEKFTIQEIS